MRLLAVIVFLCIFSQIGCSPCKKLAEKLCDCFIHQSERKECKKRLDLQAKHKAFEQAENQTHCEAFLEDKNCDCKAILTYEYEKCGLTR